MTRTPSATGGTVGIVIRHNRLDNQFNEVGAVDLCGAFVAVQNVTVDDNLLNGRGFSVYGGYDPLKMYGNRCQNISFTNNHFMRAGAGSFLRDGWLMGASGVLQRQGCRHGGDDPAYRAAHNLTWSGNVWDDTVTTIGPDGLAT
jgi:hypothetical protein